MSLRNTVAFVTGAGQGLGKATALRFALAGAKVLMADISKASLEATEGALSAAERSNVISAVCDVTSPEQVSAGLDLANSKWARQVNVAVNCAGILGPMKTISSKGAPANLDKFANVLKVNVVGTFNVIRLAAERMQMNEPDKDGGRGVIINTASVAAFEGQIGQAAYSASKGAIASMTLPIARDLSAIGVRVMCIAPGLFLTPMLESLPQHLLDELAAGVPFPRRLGHPDEYAQLCQSIVENKMLNGETIRLDGALRMQPQ